MTKENSILRGVVVRGPSSADVLSDETTRLLSPSSSSLSLHILFLNATQHIATTTSAVLNENLDPAEKNLPRTFLLGKFY